MAKRAIQRETEWSDNIRNSALGTRHDYLYGGLADIIISSFKVNKHSETPICKSTSEMPG